jgi:hypothetical protein
LNGLLVARASREDPANLNEYTSISKPSEPVIHFASHDSGCDLFGDGYDIDLCCHRLQLSVSYSVACGCFSVEINRPVLEFGSGRPQYGPTVALDREGQERRGPLNVFHTTDEFLRRHSTFVAAQVVPNIGEQSFELGRL